VLNTRDAKEVVDHDFLETRSKILEIAAVLDRIDRAPARPGEHPDPRLGQLRQALEALLEPGPGRAETVQRIFSLVYDPSWRKRMDVPGRIPTFPKWPCRITGRAGSRCCSSVRVTPTSVSPCEVAPHFGHEFLHRRASVVAGDVVVQVLPSSLDPIVVGAVRR